MWSSNTLKLTLFSYSRCMFCTRARMKLPVAPDIEFKDPTSELQQFLAIPLFSENERPFSPSLNEMKKAQKLFIEESGHKCVEFKCAVVDIDKCPKGTLPEVVFIGQSNVGKSSLIKAIFSKIPNLIVKTSKKPGHTRTINFFQVKNKLMLVDVPGYGFRQPQHFVQSVEGYLRHRPNLQMCFMLIDSRLGIRKRDEEMIQKLDSYNVKFNLVMTKIDLASQSLQLRNLRQLQDIRDKFMSPCCFPQPFLVSAKTNEGIGYLQSFIAYVTGNASFKGL